MLYLIHLVAVPPPVRCPIALGALYSSIQVLAKASLSAKRTQKCRLIISCLFGLESSVGVTLPGEHPEKLIVENNHSHKCYWEMFSSGNFFTGEYIHQWIFSWHWQGSSAQHLLSSMPAGEGRTKLSTGFHGSAPSPRLSWWLCCFLGRPVYSLILWLQTTRGLVLSPHCCVHSQKSARKKERCRGLGGSFGQVPARPGDGESSAAGAWLQPSGDSAGYSWLLQCLGRAHSSTGNFPMTGLQNARDQGGTRYPWYRWTLLNGSSCSSLPSKSCALSMWGSRKGEGDPEVHALQADRSGQTFAWALSLPEVSMGLFESACRFGGQSS